MGELFQLALAAACMYLGSHPLTLSVHAAAKDLCQRLGISVPWLPSHRPSPTSR
jgi:hypothetical protein